MQGGRLLADDNHVEIDVLKITNLVKPYVRYDKEQFSRLLFSRKPPDNFDSILRFDPMPRQSKDHRQNLFMTGMIVHSLDTAQKYVQLLPERLFNAEFDIRAVIRELSRYFDTISFSPSYLHPSVCFLRTDFTSKVRREFLGLHPLLSDQVNKWLENIVSNHQKQRHCEHKHKLNVRETDSQQHRQKRAQQSPEQQQLAKAACRRRDSAAASARRQVVLDFAGPATVAHLSMSVVNDSNWFFNAHEDPLKALLLFAYNSGHSYLPYVKDGVLPHSSDCPSIMSESWDSSDEIPADVHNLHAAILEQVVSQETIDERVQQFRKRIPLEGLLLACASCGVRDVFINPDDVPSDIHVKHSRAKKSSSGKTSNAQGPPDLFALQEPPPAFVRLVLSDPLCDVLRLTQEQIDLRKASGYPHIFSAYEHFQGGVSTGIYHLHPQLVDNPTGAASICVCQQCYKYICKMNSINSRPSKRKAGTKANDLSVIKNTFAICEGYDFGNLSSAPALSLLEKTLLARYVFYGSLVKLSAWNGVRQSAIKGHVIAFSTSAINQIELAADKSFPWFENDEIISCIKVSFVGPYSAAQKCLKVLCLEDGLLRANMRPLVWWLRLLKALHPGYRHINLPDREQQKTAQSKIDQIQQEILSCAQIVRNKASRNVERKAGADIAAVRTLPEDHDVLGSDGECGSDNDAYLSENNSNSDQNDSECSSDNEPCSTVDLDDPEFAQKLNIILSDSMIVHDHDTSAHDPSAADLLGGLLNVLQHHPDNAEGPAPMIRAVRGTDPINEINNNDILHYYAFPTLFIFGRGLPEGCTTIPHKLVRHLFLQYHCRFAQEPRFYFTVFNQMQRHAVSRTIVPRVRNNKSAILKFMDMINDDQFISKITSALDDPTSDEAKLLTRQIMPLMTTLGSSVPYSPSERRDMFPHFVSSMYRYWPCS